MKKNARFGQTPLIIFFIVLFIVAAGAAIFFWSRSQGGASVDPAYFDTLLLAGKYQDAEKVLQKMQSQGSDGLPRLKAAFVTRLFMHARELDSQGQTVEAVYSLEQLLRVVPKHEPAKKLLLNLKKKKGQPTTQPVTKPIAVEKVEKPQTPEPDEAKTEAQKEKERKAWLALLAKEEAEKKKELEAEQAAKLDQNKAKTEKLANEESERKKAEELRLLQEKKKKKEKEEQEQKAQAEKLRLEKIQNIENELNSYLKDKEPLKASKKLMSQAEELKKLGQDAKALEYQTSMKKKILSISEEKRGKKDYKGALALLNNAENIFKDQKFFKEKKISIKAQEKLFVQARSLRRTKPVVTIVVKNGENLKDRIAKAPAGAIIKLMPGSYSGPIEINKSLQIHGEGRVRSIQIKSQNSPIFTISSGNVLFKNLFLQATGTDGWEGILVTGGHLRCEGCYLSAKGKKRGGGNYAAIMRGRGGKLDLIDSLLFNGSSMGIILENNCRFNLKKNQVQNCRFFGIWVKDQATGLIQACKISGNSMSGISLSSSKKCTLRVNQIKSNEHYGILCDKNALAYLESNKIFQNKLTGIEARNNAKITLKKNSSEENGSYGLLADGSKTQVTLMTNNSFNNNKKGPMHEKSGAKIRR
ncbi:right-handed parallel beta-helix repeat-containing protein [Candidatus Riflebacteria bacterium]